VDVKEKRAKQKEAAGYIAGLMRESLGQFSKEERSLRLKQIHQIAITIGPNKAEKPSKRSSSVRRRPSNRRSTDIVN
jgi:hypothetical protein